MGKGIRWWARLLLGCALLAAALSVRPMSASPEGPGDHKDWATTRVAPTGPRPWLEPELLRALAAPGDAPLQVIITLRSPAGPTPLTQAAEAGPGALQARRALVDALRVRFAQSRAPLTGLFAVAREQGDLLAQRDLWIINGLALNARPTLIATLSASSAVAELRLDHERQYLNVEPLTATQVSTATDEISWGVLRIRAPEVWETLAISGTGAVVAGMDTGVDWQHPDLQPNYRGNLGHGIVIHEGAWFDAVNDGVYPYDDHGHGTHTLGTAAGRGGIGVAPGARWIGVKVLDGNGSGLDSWIHAGFQWLLAPGDDPALAPDVIVCSWGSTDARSTVFQADVEALLAAGIFPVFAAGNEGPRAGSLRSPASLPGVFAVGASDPNESVAYFSSRGPSPWDEIKPYVVAPGVDTRSAAPGGVYAYMQGTSMATPHVAGVAALMRGVSSTLPVASLAHIITATAHPLTTSLPSNISGWGRVDAFDALLAVAHPGFVTGTVRSIGGTLLQGAEVRATPHGGGGSSLATTGSDGAYRLALPPTTYDLHASAFGYTSQTQWGVVVVSDTMQRVDFAALGPLPTGVLQGKVTVAETGEPVSATVVLRPLGTPLSTTVDATGHYAFSLPTGYYTVEARGSGFRVATAPVTITAGLTTTQDFALDMAPTLLLVDEGAWYYGSQIVYWRAALKALGYVYDEVILTQASLPPDFSDLLDSHDVVLWSSPQGSPGLVDAGWYLENYLGGGGRLENDLGAGNGDGGRLLLSGQDVAYFDSGSALYVSPQPYLGEQLSARYLADDAPSRTVVGRGPFEGLTAAIEGGDGADNQRYPDEVAVRDPDKATLFWEYAGGRGGGVGAHICTPYRALFFSFGYEALAGATTREEVLERSLAWLATPPLTRGLTLRQDAEMLIGLPGEQVTHTLHLRHIGMAGAPDTMTVNLSGNRWPATVTPTVMTLAPCDSITLTVRVTIPPNTGVDARDVLTLNAHSALGAALVTATLHTKTPAPLLLVDDDRWYPMESYYTSALDAEGIAYDVWNTDHAHGGAPDAGAVTTATLTRYPLVLWFTGYDWYDPVMALEEERLLYYLDHGGRLLLSSQDFLYYDEERPLGRRMGVLSYSPEIAATEAWGVAEQPAGGLWGPVSLAYPFRNWSNAVEPAPDASSVARGQFGQPVAVEAGGILTETWRALFYAIPLESLPLAQRTEAIVRGLGRLSPLGQSHWTITPTVPLPGARVTATLTLRNDGPTSMTTTFSHTLPAALTVVEATLPPAVTYISATRQLTWTGDVAPTAPVTFTWAALVDAGASAGQALTPTVTLGLPAWKFSFRREAALRVAGPELAASGWLSPSLAVLRVGQPVTLTFALRNTGAGAAPCGTVDLWLTAGLAPITATLPPTLGTSLRGWEGALLPGETHWLTVPVRPWSWETPLRVDALLADGTGRRWERSLWLAVAPRQVFLPLIIKSSQP